MPVLLLLLTAITLSFIAYQDFRSRAVTWFFFPLLALWGAGLAFSELRSMPLLGRYVAINCGFLVVQLVVLRLWYYIRQKEKRPFIDHAIGKGDIFFLLAAGCFFSPVNFLLFYLLSLFFSLIAYLTLRLWPAVASRAPTVPLAGLQAAFLLLCLPIHLLLNLPFTDDSWITMKLP
jgi:hypothetical protein